MDAREHEGRVRNGIAREATILGAIIWAIWVGEVLFLTALMFPGEVRAQAMAQPFFFWLALGPIILLSNLFMPYAERRTGVRMQGPKAIRGAEENLLFSVFAFYSIALAGLVILLLGLTVDPTYFFIIGLGAYYLAGAVYNRSADWGPMAKVTPHQ